VAHPYLKAKDLTHHFGGELLFSSVDLVLNPGDRLGLVGPNGAGKTTLLRILAGQLRPVGGQVTSRASIGWSGQAEPPAGTPRAGTPQAGTPQAGAQQAGTERNGGGGPEATVERYLTGGLGRVAVLAERMRQLEGRLADADAGTLAEYAGVQDQWSMLRGWTAESRIDTVRDRLGLAHLPAQTPVAALSGGEWARLTLARLLLAEPDVLVLDEPTNHLDADAARWLGGYLAKFTGGVILASHDRAFLDAAVTQIIELDGIDPVPVCYIGGYSEYRAEKARRWQRRLLDFEAQQKYRARLEADIAAVKDQALATELSTRNDKLRRYAKKVARKAKARERRLERQIQSVQWLAEPQTRPPLILALPPEPAVGSAAGSAPILTARGLSVRLAGRPVLDDVGLEVRPAERVLISGPNGAGKTTLLRTLAGQLKPQAGHVGGTSQAALLPQCHDDLPATMPVLEFLRSRVALYADEAEQLLAAYQFSPDQYRSALRTLSDGELRRLLLAALVNSGSRVLMLDEPTHYLDFDALEIIEEALRGYPGTLLLATHDTYFAERVGYTRHWRVAAGTVTELASAAAPS
jgi:ATPase subunit of ABC transporter with duplicated ATPase domains